MSVGNLALGIEHIPKSSQTSSFSKSDYVTLGFSALLGMSCVLLLDNPVFATSVGGIQSLTDMFQTQTFRGSAEALSGANWIGMCLHYVISWFSFLGLCLTIYQKFITLLYLSSRNLFDTIYEIKKESMKGSMFGYKDFAGKLFTNDVGGKATGGGGLDVFITFFYSLLPNVKAYSDYAPEGLNSQGGKGSLQETDGVTAYMLKTAIPTIMLIFFLTIGYSGTLTKAYGIVVDGMATAADNLVSRNLSSYVDKLIGEGGGYTFTLSSSNTASGDYAQDVAIEVYNSVLGMTSNTNTEFQQALGRVIEDSVAGTGGVAATGVSSSILAGGSDEAARENLRILTDATLPEVSKVGSGSLSETEVASLKSPSVSINTNPEIIGNTGITWNVSDLLSATGASPELVDNAAERYVHVITYKGTSTNTNYLIPYSGSSTYDPAYGDSVPSLDFSN